MIRHFHEQRPVQAGRVNQNLVVPNRLIDAAIRRIKRHPAHLIQRMRDLRKSPPIRVVGLFDERQRHVGDRVVHEPAIRLALPIRRRIEDGRNS